VIRNRPGDGLPGSSPALKPFHEHWACDHNAIRSLRCNGLALQVKLEVLIEIGAIKYRLEQWS
jgi:hypothetical protein